MVNEWFESLIGSGFGGRMDMTIGEDHFRTIGIFRIL
jgi:hypothetical protein